MLIQQLKIYLDAKKNKNKNTPLKNLFPNNVIILIKPNLIWEASITNKVLERLERKQNN